MTYRVTIVAVHKPWWGLGLVKRPVEFSLLSTDDATREEALAFWRAAQGVESVRAARLEEE